MRHKVFNLISITAALLMALVITEGLLRVTNLVQNFNFLPTPLGNAGMVLHQSPNMDRNFDWFYKIQSRRYPLDSIEIQNHLLTRDEAQNKILFLGDSGTFGTGVSKELIFSSLIEEKLATDFSLDSYQVINAGIPGAIPADCYWVLKNHLIQYKPKIVVFTIFMANDLNQSLFSYDDRNYSRTPFEDFEIAKIFYLGGLSLKYYFFRDEFYNSRLLREPPGKEALNVNDFFDGEYATYLSNYSVNMKMALDNFKDVLLKMKQLTDENQAQLIISIIPTRSFLTGKFDIQPSHYNVVEDLKKRGLYRPQQLDFEKPNKLIRNFLEAHHFSFSDPSMEMRTKLQEKALIPTDDHLSIAGHQVLAEKLYPLIKNKLNE